MKIYENLCKYIMYAARLDAMKAHEDSAIMIMNTGMCKHTVITAIMPVNTYHNHYNHGDNAHLSCGCKVCFKTCS